MDNFNKNLLVCWFGVFTTSMGLSQLAPILPLFIRSLGINDNNDVAFYSGLSFGITALLMAFFSPFWGFMTHKIGCKIMLLRASFGMAILTLFLAFAQSVEQIVIIRALTGIISGFISSAIIFIAIIAPKEKIAYALATLSTASVSGNLIGPLFGGLFSEFMGIRAVFILISVLLFCSFLTTLFFIQEKTMKKKYNLEKSEKKENLLFIILLFSLTFIVQAGFNSVIPIMTLFVEQIHESGSYIALWTGLVVAASGLSNLFFAPKIGKIADKISTSKIIIFSLAFSGIIFYLQSFAHNIYILIFLRLLLGVALGGLLPCINALFKKNVSAAKLGLVFGFNQSAHALGNFIGSLGGGILAAKFSIEIVFSVVGLTFLLSAFVFFIFTKIFMRNL